MSWENKLLFDSLLAQQHFGQKLSKSVDVCQKMYISVIFGTQCTLCVTNKRLTDKVLLTFTQLTRNLCHLCRNVSYETGERRKPRELASRVSLRKLLLNWTRRNSTVTGKESSPKRQIVSVIRVFNIAQLRCISSTDCGCVSVDVCVCVACECVCGEMIS